MNLNNNGVRRRFAKQAKKVARWSSAQQYDQHRLRDENRRIAKMGGRVLAASGELVPSMTVPRKRNWLNSLKGWANR